jgi:hypothetical protein
MVKIEGSLSQTVLGVGPVSAVLLASAYQPAVSEVQRTTLRIKPRVGDRDKKKKKKTHLQHKNIVIQQVNNRTSSCLDHNNSTRMQQPNQHVYALRQNMTPNAIPHHPSSNPSLRQQEPPLHTITQNQRDMLQKPIVTTPNVIHRQQVRKQTTYSKPAITTGK